MSRETLDDLGPTTNFLIEVGVENPQILFVNQVNRINQEVKERGMTTDLDSTYFMSEKIAVDNFNRNHISDDAYKKTVLDLRDRYGMVQWLEELGEADSLEKAIGYWNNPKQLTHLPLTPGTKELFYYLHTIEIPVGRVTARPGRVAAATRLYFELNEPHIDQSLIYVQDEDIIDPKFKIGVILDVLGSGVHLEDAPEEAEVVAKEGVVVGLFPQAWNEGYKPKSHNIVTLDQVSENGPRVLSLDMEEFKQLPTMIQVYFAVGDRLLQDIK